MAKKTAGGGVAAVAAMVAAAAAGAYWFYGANDASKHRKMVRSWMLKARAEVLERVEKAGVINKETYHTIVQDVLKGYTKAKDVTSAEVAQVTKDLNGAWGNIQKVYKEEMHTATPKMKTSAKKAPAKKAKR